MEKDKLRQIFVGDLFRAVHRLRSDGEVTAAIARMLNLDNLIPSPKTSSATDAVHENRRTEAIHTVAPDAIPVKREMPRTPVVKGSPKARLRVAPMSIEMIPQPDVKSAADGFVAPLIAASADEEREALPTLLSLLNPAWTRAILGAAVEMRADDGPVDIPAVVEQVVQGLIPSRLPRLSLTTLRRGAHVLIDRGSGMVPFARDADQLAGELASLVGADITAIFRFRGIPTAGLFDVARRREVSFNPPSRGVPLILITDLGIAEDPLIDGKANVADWADFFRDLRWFGCPAVVFIPYPRRRWPSHLRRAALLIEWDRRTTAGGIRASRRFSAHNS